MAKKSCCDAGRSWSCGMLLEGGLIGLYYLMLFRLHWGSSLSFHQALSNGETSRIERKSNSWKPEFMLEMELLTIRLWFKYIMIKMLHWLNGNFLCCVCVLVCAICDGRQCICENPRGLRNFFDTYIFILIQVLQVFLFGTIMCRVNFIGEDQCSLPLSICIGPQTYLLWSSLCQLTFFWRRRGKVVSWQMHDLGWPCSYIW